MTNPYKALPNHHFWRRSISYAEKHEVDPCVAVKFKIGKNDRVVTAGSCFAQHLSKALARNGFNYYVTESGDGLSEQERRARNYGIYTARYGNIYTIRQFRQLLDEAFNGTRPVERVWRNSDGMFIDPFRPNIEPSGFDDEQSLVNSREIMLSCVRKMIETGDVLVYTLGLTEAWRCKTDGAVFPIVPGASGGEYDERIHEFVNFGIHEVLEDLEGTMDFARQVNPNLRVILTVSPVPLIATFENQHVLSSTIYSKSVLRVAAEEFVRSRDWAQYFPSYEIIVGNHAMGSYFASDLREVTHSGVAHVMRVVLDKLVETSSEPYVSHSHMDAADDIVCDEEALDHIR